MNKQPIEYGMDDWVKANDDAIHAKELVKNVILVARCYTADSIKANECGDDYLSRNYSPVKEAARKAADFISQILANGNVLSRAAMRVAVDMWSDGSQYRFVEVEACRVLTEFSKLVAEANPALSTAKDEEVEA